jgi:hypothetical protein
MQILGASSRFQCMMMMGSSRPPVQRSKKLGEKGLMCGRFDAEFRHGVLVSDHSGAVLPHELDNTISKPSFFFFQENGEEMSCQTSQLF